MKIFAPLALVIPAFAIAEQKPFDLPCQSRSENAVAIRTTKTEDRLVAFTSGGPCLRATLTIELRDTNGSLLYRYKRTLLNASIFEWEDASLAQQVETFVKQIGTTAAEVDKAKYTLEILKSETYSDTYKLKVPRRDYSRLLSSEQPFIYLPTYYEGGRYLVYDPKMRKIRIVMEWGL